MQTKKGWGDESGNIRKVAGRTDSPRPYHKGEPPMSKPNEVSEMAECGHCSGTGITFTNGGKEGQCLECCGLGEVEITLTFFDRYLITGPTKVPDGTNKGAPR